MRRLRSGGGRGSFTHPCANDVLGCRTSSIETAVIDECVWKVCVWFGGGKGKKNPTDKVFRQTSYKDLKKGLYIPESLSGILS